MNQFRNRSHAGKVSTDNRGRSQRIRHAALKDQIHIHQPVAHDRVSEGKGEQS